MILLEPDFHAACVITSVRLRQEVTKLGYTVHTDQNAESYKKCVQERKTLESRLPWSLCKWLQPKGMSRMENPRRGVPKKCQISGIEWFLDSKCSPL